MALPTLDLDDLTYPQLLDILRSHLPGDQWSDHNPSDPGIMLLELLTWLGEMGLYRMNQVPRTHQEKFLKLLVDPPVPVTVWATLRLTPPRTSGFPLPAGLRFATGYRGGRRYVFESFEPVVLSSPPKDAPQTGQVRLRAVRDLHDVVLGISDGTPHQVFPLPESPVLVDFAARAPGYDPNPRVRVGAEEWELRGFLLTEESRTTPPPRHFMVEEFENRIRFGDGTFGAIPPAGETIRLLHAQVLEDQGALISEGQLEHFLNPERITGLAAGEQVQLAGNTDASGGEHFFPPEEQLRRGLETFRNPTRLVTTEDFERVSREDFNVFQQDFNLAQGLPPEQDRVQRAIALMNRKPPLDTSGVQPGHVTLMVLPAHDEALFPTASLAQKAAMVTPSPGLQRRLLAFLEPRRLITTRLHVVGPLLQPVSAQVVVVVESQRNTTEMERTVRSALTSYLSPTRGHDDQLGWPLGKKVRRSQLYRLLEDLPGVDHVESLSLSPVDATGDVPMGPRQLPTWDTLVIQVKRT